MTSEYRPGVCNIGQRERRLRYGFAVVGFLVAIALVMAVVVSTVPRWVLLLTAAPLFGGFVSYYQGRDAFCVGYAVAGLYNVGDSVGEHAAVTDEDAIRQDRRKSLRLLGRAAVPAIAISLLLYLFLPT